MTIVIFVLGTLLGSFLNVVIYRIPRKESLVLPGSHCPHCGAPIKPWDNIPIVSFLLLRGRCRSCRQPISWRYPAVELVTAITLTALWVMERSLLDFLAGTLFALLLLAIFFIDLEHQLVPNALSYPGIVLGLVLAIPQGRFTDALFSAAGSGAAFLLIAIVSSGGMGGGDIKLAAAMGAFLGWPAIFLALVVAFTGGAVTGLVLIALRKRTRKDPLPFGPFLAAGGLVALFAAGPIIAWYLR